MLHRVSQEGNQPGGSFNLYHLPSYHPLLKFASHPGCYSRAGEVLILPWGHTQGYGAPGYAYGRLS
ncbi:hypothetical protein MTHERMOG20_00660 [Moorella thermoacetica]|nr:hypothetical protein MTHERMOG20_00660 [Moorella thermoacetica]